MLQIILVGRERVGPKVLGYPTAGAKAPATDRGITSQQSSIDNLLPNSVQFQLALMNKMLGDLTKSGRRFFGIDLPIHGSKQCTE